MTPVQTGQSKFALSDPDSESTIAFYDARAEAYAEQTAHVDLSEVYDRFLALAPAGPILDAGSGGGRDTLAFLQRKRDVDAFDASPELARISTARTGVETLVARFETFETTKRYAGIWACASLLHVAQFELSDAIGRLTNALAANGVFFMSFKYGDEQRMEPDGRRFTDLNEVSLSMHIHRQARLRFNSMWVFDGASTAGKTSWLNAMAVRKPRIARRRI
jgi:SAM-dependent methyltransferase